MLGERCNVSDQKSHLAKPRKSGQISPIWRPGERCKGTSRVREIELVASRVRAIELVASPGAYQ